MLTVPSIPKNLQFIFSRNCISKTNHFSLLRIQFNGMKLNAIFFRQHKIIIMNTFKKIVMFCNNLVSSSDSPFLPDNLWIQYRAINRDTIFLTNILLIKRSFCNTTKFSKQKKWWYNFCLFVHQNDQKFDTVYMVMEWTVIVKHFSYIPPPLPHKFPQKSRHLHHVIFSLCDHYHILPLHPLSCEKLTNELNRISIDQRGSLMGSQSWPFDF